METPFILNYIQYDNARWKIVEMYLLTVLVSLLYWKYLDMKLLMSFELRENIDVFS